MNKRQTKKHDQLRARYKAERKAQILLEKIPELRAKIHDLEDGAAQLRRVLDSILISAAKAYGVPEYEDEDLLGYRLEIPAEEVETVLTSWVLRAEKRDGKVILAAMPKNIFEKS